MAIQKRADLPDQGTPQQALLVEFAKKFSWMVDDITYQVNRLNAQDAKLGKITIEEHINGTVDDVSGLDADLFQPTPTNWKQILSLPPHMKKHWSKSFKK